MLTLFGVGTVRYTLQNSCPPFDRLSLVGMLTKCKQREKFILCSGRFFAKNSVASTKFGFFDKNPAFDHSNL